MTEFTYEPPNEDAYLKALKSTGKNKAYLSVEISKFKKCSIESTGEYTRRRWNEYKGIVTFTVSMDEIGSISDEIKNAILQICNSIMPPNCGIYLEELHVVPDYDDNNENQLDDMLSSSDESIKESISINIDQSVIDKGLQLSKVYNLLFVIENTLRMYISKKLEEQYGSAYYDICVIPANVRSTIQSRIDQEQKK
jgi:hypothetical protein